MTSLMKLLIITVLVTHWLAWLWGLVGYVTATVDHDGDLVELDHEYEVRLYLSLSNQVVIRWSSRSNQVVIT